MGAHNSSAEILFSLHYPTSQLFPSDARFARWIASLSWSWLSNPKALSVFTSLPALQTVKSGWPRGRIIPPSSLEVVVVPCGACRTTSFCFCFRFFSVADDFGGRRMPRKNKRHYTTVFFVFFASFWFVGGQQTSFSSCNFWVCLLSVKLGRTPWYCHHFLKVSKKSWPFTPSRTGRWVFKVHVLLCCSMEHIKWFCNGTIQKIQMTSNSFRRLNPATKRWMFPQIGVPQNGWFMMENPIKMDDLGVPLFSETPRCWIQLLVFFASHFGYDRRQNICWSAMALRRRK